MIPVGTLSLNVQTHYSGQSRPLSREGPRPRRPLSPPPEGQGVVARTLLSPITLLPRFPPE